MVVGRATWALLAVWMLGVAPSSAGVEAHRRRGINITESFAYPTLAAWPYFEVKRAAISDVEFAKLAQAGFTFVRLPVEPAPFLEHGSAHRTELLSNLRTFVARANAQGLAVLLTGFPRDGHPPWSPEVILASTASPSLAGYASFLDDLADVADQALPGMAALELMNEPQHECWREARAGVAPDWTVLQKPLHQRLRARHRELVILVTGGCWSGRQGLEHLDMSSFDERTLVSVHYYEPFAFTHQGAEWMPKDLQTLAGAAFPARLTDASAASALSRRRFEALASAQMGAGELNLADLEGARTKLWEYLKSNVDETTIETHLSQIARFADREHIPHDRIVITEFGAYRGSQKSPNLDDGSRARWLEAVQLAAKAQGMGWGMWSYRAGFGLFADAEQRTYDTAIIKALGLKVPSSVHQ